MKDILKLQNIQNQKKIFVSYKEYALISPMRIHVHQQDNFLCVLFFVNHACRESITGDKFSGSLRILNYFIELNGLL